jgi:hypothetical protein
MLALSAMSATKKFDGSWTTYPVKLLAKLKKMGDVTTKIKLKGGEKSADGKPYALATFFRGADLSVEDKKAVAVLREMFATAMRAKPIEAEEAEEANGNGHGGEKRDPWDREKP